jgi:hypothetical protein
MRNLVSAMGAAWILSTAIANAEDAAPSGTRLAQEGQPAESPAAESVEKATMPMESVRKEGAAVGESVGLRGGERYGLAGCGLGSMIFEPSAGFTQVFASTTNSTFGIQTFAITSGTSNCEPEPGEKSSAKAFVFANRSALAKDIARGKGETIASLTEIAGCRDARAVGQKLQKNFKVIFPSAKATDEQVSESVVEILRGDGLLACSALNPQPEVSRHAAERESQPKG